MAYGNPSCSDSVISSVKDLKGIKDIKHIRVVSVGLEKMGGKKDIGHIVSHAEKCEVAFVQAGGKVYRNLKGYKATGAEECSDEEVFIKESALEKNINGDLNKWVPKGNIATNPQHFLERWNTEKYICNSLKKSKINGCIGSCEAMLDESPSKEEFCKMMSGPSAIKAGVTCYQRCCEADKEPISSLSNKLPSATDTKSKVENNFLKSFQAYNQAFTGLDFMKMSSFIEPDMLASFGGVNTFVNVSKAAFAKSQKDGMDLSKTKLTPIGDLIQIDGSFFKVVTTEVPILTKDTKDSFYSYQLAISDDGEYWYFFEGGDQLKENLKTNLPKVLQKINFPGQRIFMEKNGVKIFRILKNGQWTTVTEKDYISFSK